MGKLMVGLACALLLCTVVLVLSAVAATFTKFDNFAAYEAALGRPLNMQGFEGLAHGDNLNGVEFLPGISVTSNLPEVEVFGSGGDQDLFGLGSSVREQGVAFYDINFSQPYNAVGFNIESFNPATPGPAIIEIFFADQTSTSIDIFPTNATELDPIFFGVIADTPIARIRLREGPEIGGFGNEEVSLDDFVIAPTAPVPQPTPSMFNVDARLGWQTSSLNVTAGQQLSFSASGSWTVDQSNFSFVGPEGYSPEVDSTIFQGCKLDPSLPYGRLLVRVGDDPTFQIIGSTGTLTATRDGLVAFRIHDADGCLSDNAGAVQVTVTVSDLPPDPGEAGKATLEGIDSDNDGVRDDAQRHIALTVTDSARHREALRSVARNIQRELLAQTKEESIQAAIEGVRTIECLSYLGVLNQHKWEEVEALMLNTEARLRAMDAHNDRITGQVFSFLPDSLERSACTFDVEALPN